MKLAVRALLLGIGLLLLGWFVQRAQPAEIWAAFSKVHWFAPLILLPYLLVYVADTYGWKFAFGEKFWPPLKFSTLLRIRWAGEAVNNVVPSAYIGGEALKVYLLGQRGVSVEQGTASVVAGKTAQTVGQIAFLCLGAIALWIISAGETRVQVGSALIIAGLLLGLIGLFWLQSLGPFSLALQVLTKIGIPISSPQEKLAKLRLIDDRLLRFYREDRKYFLLSALLYSVGWLSGVLEVLVIAHLVDLPLMLSQAVALEAFVGVAKIFGMIVPGALGFQESGIVLLCRAAALPEAFGFSYAILRRGRELVFALIGLTIVYLEEVTLKSIVRRVTGNGNDS